MYDAQCSGKTYRLVHARHLIHPDMLGMYAVSGALSLATGDQSFMEAIQANKMICYDCLPHKELLYSAYQDAGNNYSISTQEALALMRLNSRDRSVEMTQRLVTLLKSEQVRVELSSLNESIRKKDSLVPHYENKIAPHYSVDADAIAKAIVDRSFNESMLAQVEYPKHLSLAIRYGFSHAVELMVDKNKAALAGKDRVGNNVFIIAAQNNRYDILAQLIQYAAAEKIPFDVINQPNQHFAQYTVLDYLPDEIKQNPTKMEQIFSVYMSDITKQRDLKMVTHLAELGFYRVPKGELSSNSGQLSELAPHWQIIEGALAEKCSSYENEELINEYIPFLMIMGRYYQNKPEYAEDLAEVKKLCAEIPDFVYEEGDFIRYKEHVLNFLKITPTLNKYMAVIEHDPALAGDKGDRLYICKM